MDTTTDSAPARILRCMEIWGGSHAIEEPLDLPGLDGWLYSRPYADGAAGGDVHFVSLCAGGIVSRFILADVSGHGVKVSDLASSLRSLMKRYINHKSQTAMVRSLNREFGELGRSSRFATAVVLTYLAHKRRLTLCNAGHPRPLYYQAATGRWLLLERDSATAANLPLGIDEQTPYDQFSLTLGDGYIVLLYTDAVIETPIDDSRYLGEEGLLALIEKLGPPRDAHHLGHELLRTLESIREGRMIDDDLSVIVLRHNQSHHRSIGVIERLEAMARMVGLKAT